MHDSTLSNRNTLQLKFYLNLSHVQPQGKSIPRGHASFVLGVDPGFQKGFQIFCDLGM